MRNAVRAGFLTRHRVGVASAAAVAVAAGSIVAYALASDGYRAHKTELYDGGVWTVNDRAALIGRVNTPIRQLDSYLEAAGAQAALDVLQDGAAVAMFNKDAGTLTPVDVVTSSQRQDAKVALAGTDVVAMNGGTLAVLDPDDGGVRALRYDAATALTDLSALDSTAKPLAKLGRGAALAVGVDGTIALASPSHGFSTITPQGSGFAKRIDVAIDASGSTYAVTMVGSQPVALISSEGAGDSTLAVSGGRTVTIANSSATTLQQPGTTSADVFLSNRTTLTAVPLKDGNPQVLFSDGGDGAPAAPVTVGGCTYAAWASALTPTLRRCGTESAVARKVGKPSSSLVFRVNRGNLVLNDQKNGRTWTLDTGTPIDAANWDEVRPKQKNDSDDQDDSDNRTTQQQVKPPTARDDPLGARPGQVTSLYVLDNDSDPSGGVLAIDKISSASDDTGILSVSPDGQAVLIDMPTGKDEVDFQYRVSSTASEKSTQANVTVHAVAPDQENAPVPRIGRMPHDWTVPINGTLTIPILSDWRDYQDGDEVEVTRASTAAPALAIVTTDGDIVYRAPDAPGTYPVTYTIGDGHGRDTGAQQLSVKVLGRADDAVAPTANADAARGIVGTPIVIRPLANDLPGADPQNPSTSLQLTANVAQPKGYRVDTDLSRGTVTVTTDRTGVVVLNYSVSYGDAPVAKSQIRVVVKAKSSSTTPVAAPDVITIHGQSSAIVDVLANDFDPLGNVLAVQHAEARDASGGLSVGVIDGHWLRVGATSAATSTATRLVSYTVTDGRTGSVTGQLTVYQQPEVDDDVPLTLDDYAIVRAGDAGTIPVLDNDTLPSGGALALRKSGVDTPAVGALTVTPKQGAAYVSGRVIRYVAPARVTEQTEVDVDYTAETADGSASQGGVAHVTITAPVSARNVDQPPTPPTIEARVVAGDTIMIAIPSSGVDPDGDSVVTTGIASSPTKGRILDRGPNSIMYQAYPFADNGGTDTFDYLLTDTQNVTATGTIRIAVVPPGDPQRPVAVPDFVTAAPGSTVEIDALANDLVTSRSLASIDKLTSTNAELPAGISVVDRQLVVHLAQDATKQITFQYKVIEAGAVSEPATVTVNIRAGTNIAPVAFDQYASPKVGDNEVSVQPLRGDRAAYDPDSTDALTVTSRGRTASGGVITVALTRNPQAIPYTVTDAAGGVASAMIYVPATLHGLPRGNGQTITMGDTKTVDITDYVVDPAGAGLQLASASKLSAGPSTGLRVSAGADGTHFVLERVGDYNGPAQVTFEVRSGTSLNTPRKALISVPVQVGPKTPVLRCPTAYVTTVVQGGEDVPLGLGTLCHVWTATAADYAALRFDVTWKTDAGGVSIVGSGGGSPVLRPSRDAKPGDTGELDIGVSGSKAIHAQLPVKVVSAPPMTVRAIPVTGLKATERTTIDLGDFATSPLRDHRFAVVGKLIYISGDKGTTMTANGSAVTIKVGSNSRDRVIYQFVLTDAPNAQGTGRLVTGRITVDILGRPSAPRNLAAVSKLDGKVKLRWDSPQYGAPDLYTMYQDGHKARNCDSGCVVDGLKNGQPYHFFVTATNPAGEGAHSDTVSATPDKVPGRVETFTFDTPQDKHVTLHWSPVRVDGKDKVTQYRITTRAGVVTAGATDTFKVVATPDNDSSYPFSIVAVNDLGAGVSHSIKAQSAGRPAPPGSLAVAYSDDLGSSSSARRLKINWTEGARQGPGPATYTVTRGVGTNAVVVDGCDDIVAKTCQDTPPTGAEYTYSVTERNAAPSGADDPAHTSAAATATFRSSGRPDRMAAPTLNPVQASDPDGALTTNFTTADAHAGTFVVHCIYTTDGTTPVEGSSESCGDWSEFTGKGQSATKTLSLTEGASITLAMYEENTDSNLNEDLRNGELSPPVTSATTTNGPPQAPGNGSCNLSGDQLVVNWGGVASVGARTTTYRVRLDSADVTGATDVQQNTGTSFNTTADGSHHTAYVWSTDGYDTTGPTTIGGGNCKYPDPPPPPQPTITAYDGGLGTHQPGSCRSCHTINFQVHNFPTGDYTWYCYQPDGQYVDSSDLNGTSYTVHVTSSEQTFSGTALSYCENTNTETWIRFNNIDSSHVVLGSG